ncbi:MAG: four helix bundle protein [Pseudomonadota bacterium]
MADQISIKSHRDLTVWRKAVDLAKAIYKLTDGLPKKEEYRMTAQLVRAAISIPANIAEGNARGTRRDYANFVSIARGSTAELETLLTIVAETNMAPREKIAELLEKADEVGRMLNGLRRSLSNSDSVDRARAGAIDALGERKN